MQPSLYWQLHQLAFLLEKHIDESLKNEVGVGFAQYKVLEAVNQNMLANQAMVAKLLDQTEAGISRQIKILERRGLLFVGKVAGNKRTKELSLTEIGEEIVQQCEGVLELVNAQVIGSLGYQEQRLFHELFERMLQRAKKL